MKWQNMRYTILMVKDHSFLYTRHCTSLCGTTGKVNTRGQEAGLGGGDIGSSICMEGRIHGYDGGVLEFGVWSGYRHMTLYLVDPLYLCFP
jgi:hypothetical protein